MPKSKMQSGYMELKERSYIFTYDGVLLQLVPKEQDSIKPDDTLVNKNIYLAHFSSKLGRRYTNLIDIF